MRIIPTINHIRILTQKKVKFYFKYLSITSLLLPMSNNPKHHFKHIPTYHYYHKNSTKKKKAVMNTSTN